MADNSLQIFLNQVFTLTSERCGPIFTAKINLLHKERERILEDSWKVVSPENLDDQDKQIIFREIDFDTMVFHAIHFIDQEEYPTYLYEVCELAIGFGQFEKAQRLLSLIQNQYSKYVDKNLFPKVHQRFGDIAFYQSDYKISLEEYERALQLYADLNNIEGLIAIKNSMAVVKTEKGEVQVAEQLFNEALTLAKREGFNDLQLKIRMNLGNVLHIQGSYAKALSNFHDALALVSEEDHVARARITHNIGIVFKSQGVNDRALAEFEKSIKLSIKANNRYQKGLSYLEKAEILYRTGDLLSSTALATSAFQIFSTLQDRLSIADVYKIFGLISKKRKENEIAISYLEHSKRINQDYHNPLNLGETLYELAQLYTDEENINDALKNYNLALIEFESVNAQQKIKEVRQAISGITT